MVNRTKVIVPVIFFVLFFASALLAGPRCSSCQQHWSDAQLAEHEAAISWDYYTCLIMYAADIEASLRRPPEFETEGALILWRQDMTRLMQEIDQEIRDEREWMEACYQRSVDARKAMAECELPECNPSE